MARIEFKLTSSIDRVGDWIVMLPKLWCRLILHLSYFVPFLKYQLACKPDNFLLAILELFFYLLDATFISTGYDLLSEWFKWSTRPMTVDEVMLSKIYFGDTIKYRLVRIHAAPNWWNTKSVLAYVSMNTINHFRPISEDVFIHEMMHVWQYQQMGSVYIVKALYAQYKGNPYEYGGIQGLYNGMIQGKNLLTFNFEQQAEIIQDYCRLQKLNALDPLSNSVYRYYASQVITDCKV